MSREPSCKHGDPDTTAQAALHCQEHNDTALHCSAELAKISCDCLLGGQLAGSVECLLLRTHFTFSAACPHHNNGRTVSAALAAALPLCRVRNVLLLARSRRANQPVPTNPICRSKLVQQQVKPAWL